jgi:hypothetical protein
MKPPFPGMDPYLEAHDIWPDFHNALASQLRELLNAGLPQPYYARLDVRSEIGIVTERKSRRRIIPDVTVIKPKPPFTLHEARSGYRAMTEPRTEVSPGVHVEIKTERYDVPFLEIRDASRNHRLVTLIEIISPSNKQPGPDRDAYLKKQWEILHSDASLIEIDLLRGGQRPLPEPELEVRVSEMACDYLILVNRSADRKGYGLEYIVYPVGVREILPCIPVPLAGDAPDIPLDLNAAVQRTYVSGPYARLLDYTVPPDPPLNPEDAAWAESLLRGEVLQSAPTP